MSKRPVAFRVPRLLGDMVSHYFVTTSEDEARAMADTNQVEYEGLYLVGDRHTGDVAQPTVTSGKLTFGVAVENIAASDRNPIKYGIFIRKTAAKMAEYATKEGVHSTPLDNLRAAQPPAAPVDPPEYEYVEGQAVAISPGPAAPVETDWFDECAKQAGKAFRYWLALEKAEERFRGLDYLDFANEIRAAMADAPEPMPVPSFSADSVNAEYIKAFVKELRKEPHPSFRQDKKAADLIETLYLMTLGVSPAQPQTAAWQSMATAPKDGPAFLVWVPENLCIYEVVARDGNLSIFGGGFRDNLHRATLWQPLPASPLPRPHRS